MIKERPILFNTEMVTAVLEGRKTQTRRFGGPWEIGDLLWVRETWVNYFTDGFLYKASCLDIVQKSQKWKPSIHMPKSAARIWLQITDIKFQHLHEISELDAKKEGVEYWESSDLNEIQFQDYLYPQKAGYMTFVFTAVSSFKTLWKSVYGVESWKENPFVLVIEFKVLSTIGIEEAYRVLESEVKPC